MLVMTRLVRARGALRLLSALGALTLVLTGIFLTGSRGGLVAAAVGMVTVLVYERGRHVIKYAVPLAIVAAVAFAVAPPALQNRFTDPSSTGRSDIWQVGFRGCQQHCLSGSGLGTFPDVYRTTLLTALDLKGHGVQDFKAHNIWLAMVVETGFAGLLLGVAGVGLLLRDVHRLPRSARTGPLAGMVAVLVANLFLSNFSFKYFWLALTYAVIVVLAEPAPHAESTSAELHPAEVPATITRTADA
jgi:O-antigen ligase